MELRKILILLILVFLNTSVYAELTKPNKKLEPYDVVKIQLEALKNNNKDDNGIKQTWLFAHPDNKKITGPYERFRIMIYGQQYKFLLNHSSHKINLITNSPNKFIYRIEILSDKKQLFFYEWHVQKGSEEKCKNCWFTSAVSIPVDQGNTI
tara:strand:+ start:18 stop:473 length:456 start_codon:yes stop_codon:yes gene_type:complete